jgi:hypothetical protein
VVAINPGRNFFIGDEVLRESSEKHSDPHTKEYIQHKEICCFIKAAFDVKVDTTSTLKKLFRGSYSKRKG